MPHRFILRIADVEFVLSSRRHVSFLIPSDSYKSFINPPDAAGMGPRITVELTDCPRAGKRVLIPVFRAEDTWTLFRDGSTRVIRYPSDAAQPFCEMVITRGWHRIVVHVGKPLIRVNDGESCLTNPFRYPLDQVVLMNLLAETGGGIFHCCGAGLNGKGLIFLARSGGGKTTLARLLAQRESFRVLSDDRIVIRGTPKGLRCFGTPWPGMGGMARNEALPLRALFFLVKGPRNRILSVGPAEAIERLLPVTSVPWYDVAAFSRVVSFCGEVVRQVPCYELQFRPNVEVTDVIARHVGRMNILKERRPICAAK